MAELADQSASEMRRRFATGEVRPSEALEAVLRRVEAWQPRIHAFTHVMADAARQAARDPDERYARGEPLGVLDGVPVTVKENIATAGDPYRMGTAATPPTVSDADAPAAARLKEGGAVIFAKTTMPDFGMLTSGVSSLHPTTRNPWTPDWNPGGSSAGAGAAAAAGIGPIHLGTDIGGSVRLPAGWCGVAGLKPSFGRIPVSPPYYGRCIGPLARKVGDLPLAMAVVTAPDERDHMSLPAAELPWTELATPALATARIGLCTDAGAGVAPAPEIVALVEQAARALAARALPYIREWTAPAADFSGEQVFTGFSAMDRMAVAVAHALGELDFLLTPVAPMATY